MKGKHVPARSKTFERLSQTARQRIGAEFAACVRKQFQDYGRIIREAKIKGE